MAIDYSDKSFSSKMIQDVYAEVFGKMNMSSVQINKPQIFQNKPMASARSMQDYQRNQMLLCGRLKIKEGDQIPFNFIEMYVTDEVAFVFVVNGKEHVTLEDDPNMFPSDKLITELRLLIGSK